MLFLLRYMQAANAKYVHYFSNYTWIVALFFVFTFAHAMLVVASLWPSFLNRTTVLDGIRLVDAQMYNSLVAQSQWILGFDVRCDIFKFINNKKT